MNVQTPYLQPASIYTGVNVAMAKSPAGQTLDLINIMSYDAGSVSSTGFDPIVSFDAHRSLWGPNAAVAMGVEIPPEAWGGNILNIDQLTQFSKYVKGKYDSNRQTGMMLWSLNKNGTPSPSDVLKTACSVLEVEGGCAGTLPK